MQPIRICLLLLHSVYLQRINQEQNSGFNSYMQGGIPLFSQFGKGSRDQYLSSISP